jgi:hypothetical protein
VIGFVDSAFKFHVFNKIAVSVTLQTRKEDGKADEDAFCAGREIPTLRYASILGPQARVQLYPCQLVSVRQAGQPPVSLTPVIHNTWGPWDHSKAWGSGTNGFFYLRVSHVCPTRDSEGSNVLLPSESRVGQTWDNRV